MHQFQGKSVENYSPVRLDIEQRILVIITK